MPNKPTIIVSGIGQETEFLSDYFDLTEGESSLSFKDDVLSFGELYFDFIKDYSTHLKKSYRLGSEPLAKALGLHKNNNQRVVDLTCGTGKDSILLLSFGANVLAYERVPITAALLLDARRRLLKKFPELTDRFQVRFGEYVNEEVAQVDCLYFDPMYDHKRKSALPRKEMVFFKELAGKDEDQVTVLEKLINTAKVKKIVVKRALKAPEVLPHVNAKFLGKTTRYDLYLPKS